ncbi:hypothetical protein FGU71_10385 [Erythrobacter insulae]|uniref:Uncharacterized protein n=1 Tax=Erythrobacter insulae TaxID=2584124 RepID=A0A547PDL2_9SPHN|nr:hypothetical protein [Erythrobacter insulae]TRD12228.1 hypothetical protein FGU71_10385 [Erythrobacter insulae]
MIKAQAEKAIRQMCIEWAKEMGLDRKDYSTASFVEFWQWAQSNYSSYFKFRTSTGVRYDVEKWFEDEMGQKGFE